MERAHVTWQPKRFRTGDRVLDPERTRWGIGVVVEERPYALQCGQKLLIDWADRRIRTTFNSQRCLELVTTVPDNRVE